MNGKRMLAAGLLGLAAWAGGFGASRGGEALPGLASPGRLVVGLDDTFAPMGFRDPAGNLVGFDIDLARAVGAEMGLEVLFQPVEWSAKEMELAARNIDCLWNGMSRTPDREKSMTLSQDYLNNKLAVMTVPGAAAASLEELAKLQIGTQAASSSLEAVQAHPKFALIRPNLREYATYDECILDMQAGRLQAMIVDEVLGQYKNRNLGAALQVAPVDFGDDFYVIGFRRDADNAANEQLLRAVEAALKKVAASGKGAEISRKWFGADLLLPLK